LLSGVSLQQIYSPRAVNKLLKTKKTFMGRGDKKTKKGKIFKGSFGKSRPANAPVVKKAVVKKESK
jgi:30S ribosomal protein S31